MLPGYIPTSGLLSLFGLDFSTSTAVEKLVIRPLDYMGKEYPIYNIAALTLQYNPEKLPEPDYTVDYLRMEALGLVNPTLHYTGAKYEAITLNFPIVDSFEGPPHATISATGSIVYNDFADLYEVKDWLYALGKPMLGWNKPPYVQFQLGSYIKTGVLTKIGATIVSMYGSGIPRIMECSLTLQPDIILVTSEQSYGTEGTNSAGGTKGAGV